MLILILNSIIFQFSINLFVINYLKSQNRMFSNHFQSLYLSNYPQIDLDSFLKNSIFSQWAEILVLLQNQRTLQNCLSCFKQCKTETSQDCAFKSNKSSSNYCKTNQALENFKQCVYKNIEQQSQKKKICKKIQIIPLDDQEKSQDQDQKEEVMLKKNRYSQTKNIIKNYGKSILTFAKKHPQYINRLLFKFEIAQKQFWTSLQIFRCKINTIIQLKHFWIYNNNGLMAKIFRIISHQYLRKYSLQHVFSSRVKNYPVHIKYRKRLLKALQNPQEFTFIKPSDF